MRPNILLVVMDSVRAKNTSLYGYERNTTPFLKELSEEATVYTEARSPSNWSLPSHCSIFTGYQSEEHKFYDPADNIEPGYTIWDDLNNLGYRTGMFSNNTFISGIVDTGLQSDFEKVVGLFDPPFPEGLDPFKTNTKLEFLKRSFGHENIIRSLGNGVLTKLGWDLNYLVPESLVEGTSAAPMRDRKYVEKMFDWFPDEDPWAACINLMEAHFPYRAETSSPWVKQEYLDMQAALNNQWDFYSERSWAELEGYENLYDNTILQLDIILEDIITGLKEKGEYEDTMIVITSDHGEAFGERSILRDRKMVGHDVAMIEELLHIPLVIKYPDQRKDKVIEDLVTLTNFPDSVKGVLNDETDDKFVSDRVYSSSGGIISFHIDKWEQKADSDEELAGKVKVVYMDKGDTILKRMKWRYKEIEVDLDTGMVSKIENKVEREFKGLKNFDITYSDNYYLSSKTKGQLKELGYL